MEQLCCVCNNIHLMPETRDMAFSLLEDVSSVSNLTNYMKNSLYLSAADAIFDYRDIEKTSRIFWKLKGMFPNVQELAITIGEHGYICSRDGEVIIMPAYQHGKVTIDTNGAGDIFHGAFTHALANGYDYYESLEFANVTASLSTTKAGGRKSCPNLEDVEHIIKKGGKRLVRAIER